MAKRNRSRSRAPARAESTLLPLGAMMLAASAGAWAQATPTPAPPPASALPVITVRDSLEQRQGKDSIRATTTNIGKGTQALRDIPQSITTVTEKLMDDRNLDTVKDALRNTAGITFMAAEGGEEDIRLRGFSLAQTGDIFLDGMRDPAFYDRDTFNFDRVELLRGSASMLFGRGSTGGAVNQVSKTPRLMDQHEVTATVGSHNFRRLTGDFNIHTGENAALRLNTMITRADNNGAGASIDKHGLAASYRWGIGTADEFMASLFHLDNDNGINYGLPWIRQPGTTSATNTLIPGLSPDAYYGLTSDYSRGEARIASFSHIHRFGNGAELKSQVRSGDFMRDQRATLLRFPGAANPPDHHLGNVGPGTPLNRGFQPKVQDVKTLHAQSDLSVKFDAFGMRHQVITGIDAAREEKVVWSQLTAAQGGIVPGKPQTTLGNPDDGAWVDEGLRTFRRGNDFVARAFGAYAQDLVQVAPHWKVLGGVRYDKLDGKYNQYNLAPAANVAYSQKVSEWSKRFGVLVQPSDRHSFHFSYGTSFNTSGDVYSYNATSANTPPESSVNLEIGGRIESPGKQFTTRFAIFRSTKKNERNTDADTAATRLLLSGERHASGVEIDVTGRITPKWEVYGSYMWLPDAEVDEAASCPAAGGCAQGTVGNRKGDRPGLSPRHSGTIWTTYQFTPRWRAGAGINFRGRQAPADVTAPAWEAPGFATVDLMAEYTHNDTFSVKANLANIADKYYGDMLYRGHYIPGAGRQLQVAVTARF